MCAGVAEVSDSELSDDEMADDDDDDDAENASANSLKQPLLQNRDTADGNHLSKQGRRALKHLHAVDSSVRTVVSAVSSSRKFRRSAGHRALTHPHRQENLPLWSRIRWWVIVVGATFIILPFIFLLCVKFIGTGT